MLPHPLGCIKNLVAHRTIGHISPVMNTSHVLIEMATVAKELATLITPESLLLGSGLLIAVYPLHMKGE